MGRGKWLVSITDEDDSEISDYLRTKRPNSFLPIFGLLFDLSCHDPRASFALDPDSFFHGIYPPIYFRLTQVLQHLSTPIESGPETHSEVSRFKGFRVHEVGSTKSGFGRLWGLCRPLYCQEARNQANAQQGPSSKSRYNLYSISDNERRF